MTWNEFDLRLGALAREITAETGMTCAWDLPRNNPIGDFDTPLHAHLYLTASPGPWRFILRLVELKGAGGDNPHTDLIVLDEIYPGAGRQLPDLNNILRALLGLALNHLAKIPEAANYGRDLRPSTTH